MIIEFVFCLKSAHNSNLNAFQSSPNGKKMNLILYIYYSFGVSHIQFAWAADSYLNNKY